MEIDSQKTPKASTTGSKNPAKEARKLLIKWAFLIGLGVLCFALGISLGARHHQQSQSQN